MNHKILYDHRYISLYFYVTLKFGAVVKRRQEKGRWTKGRRRHKVDSYIHPNEMGYCTGFLLGTGPSLM